MIILSVNDTGDAICALEDLAGLIGKIIPSLERLEDEDEGE